MYLLERVLSLFIFLFFLIVFSYNIYKTKKRENIKKFLFLYSIILAIMAFFYVPSKSADLFRIFESIDLYYSKMNIQTLKIWLENSSTPVSVLYYYIFGQIGIKGLLPAITVFIFYDNVFYILHKSMEKFNIEQKYVSQALFFFIICGQFIEVASGIRSMLAFSIIARCSFNELVLNKSFFKSIVWYIIASLIHPAAIVLVSIRLMLLLFQNEKKGLKKILNIFLSIIIAIFGIYFGKSYIISAGDKASSYLNKEIYSYIWEYLITIINIIYIFICILKISRLNLNKQNNINNLYKFTVLILIIDVLFSFEYSIFHRYRYFLLIIFLPLYLILYKNLSEEKFSDKTKKFYCLTYIINFILLILVFSRGNLSGLKFFNFN